MDNNKKGFINIQLFADEQGADMAQGDVGAPSQSTTPDYEKEFKALQEKYNSLNTNYIKKSEAFDKVSSEVADYKKKEREKLSDADRRNQEFQEVVDANSKLEAKVKEYETRDKLLSNGFTREECETLMKGGLQIEDFAKIMAKRLEENAKSVKAGLIKDTTPSAPMGSGTTNNEPQTYAEKLAQSKFQDSEKLQSIKDLYKK